MQRKKCKKGRGRLGVKVRVMKRGRRTEDIVVSVVKLFRRDVRAVVDEGKGGIVVENKMQIMWHGRVLGRVGIRGKRLVEG